MIRALPKPMALFFAACLAAALLAAPALAGPPVPDCCSPKYDKEVMDSYRTLQFKTSTYAEPPAAGKGIRLGVYQAQAAFGPGATARNLERMEMAARTAAERGVQLLAFPELYLPGYTLSPEQAREVAEYKDGPSITRAREVAKELSLALVLPYAEKAEEDGAMMYFDSMAVISAKGELLFSYRKTHLYGRQERDNWDFGGNLSPVVPINGLPVGVLNCYECEFPELSRILALKGAKLIVGPRPRTATTPCRGASEAPCPIRTSPPCSSRPGPTPTTSSSPTSTGRATRSAATTNGTTGATPWWPVPTATSSWPPTTSRTPCSWPTAFPGSTG